MTFTPFAIGITILVAVFFAIELVVSCKLNKPVKPKFAYIQEKSDYLVVCRNLDYAAMLCDQLARYLYDKGINCRVIKTNHRILIDTNGEPLFVRFTSENKFYEASAGFHGWVVDAHQVEEWLDAAEENKEGEE